MSGHSKWAQIKHQKAALDQKKGQLFSKLVRQINVAVKGGGPDLESNFKLRLIAEKAKSVGMPKDNIERAIQKAGGSGEGQQIEQITYEGFGPFGTNFMVEAATDNKNRTTANLRHIFEKFKGSLGLPGSVAWNFETKGQILAAAPEAQLENLELAVIEAGAEDVKTSEHGLEVYTTPLDLSTVKNVLEKNHAEIISAEIVKKSKAEAVLSDQQRETIQKLFDLLNEDEDIVSVYTSAHL